MEELDAELLAVTEGQKRSGRQNLSDGSASSGGEFEGIADSDGGDDDADLDDARDEDDDDDDDEFGLDDDDEDDDYASKAKKPKKKPPARPKKPKAKPKSTRRKSSTNSRKAATMPSDDDDSEDAFVYKYDKDGYGDDSDRDRLSRMNEVERETVLADRVEARTKEYDLWKMGRDLKARQSGKAGAAGALRTSRSSGRTKASSKSDALQALAEDKRKKSSRAFEDVSDADSEVEARSRSDRRDERKEKEEPRTEPDLMEDAVGPELQYSDIVKMVTGGQRTTTPLFLRRDTLIELSQQPYFARFVVGLFARIRVEENRYSYTDAHDGGSYLLCRIAGVKTSKVYSLSPDIRTNYVLLLQIGKQKRPIPIKMTSGSHPTEREFEVYRSRAVDAGFEMPRREEVDKLFKRTNELFIERKFRATEAENKNHIANMELLYPSRVNWTQKRTEVRTALDIKRQELSSARRKGNSELEDKFKMQVEDLERQLKDIKSNESMYGMSGVKSEDVFQGLAQRNMELNTANEKLSAKQRNMESEAGGIDPFARFDTTGQSYYSIKKKGESNEAEAPKVVPKKRQRADWLSCLKSWRPDGKKRKISEKPLDPMYAGEIIGFDAFKREPAEVSNGDKDKVQGPPRIDAMYSDFGQNEVKLPPKAKIIAFEEWSKMRGMF